MLAKSVRHTCWSTNCCCNTASSACTCAALSWYAASWWAMLELRAAKLLRAAFLFSSSSMLIRSCPESTSFSASTSSKSPGARVACAGLVLSMQVHGCAAVRLASLCPSVLQICKFTKAVIETEAPVVCCFLSCLCGTPLQGLQSCQ